MELRNQTCKECEFFIPYYCNFGTHFIKTEYGFCSKQKVTSKKRNRHSSFAVCDKFKPDEDKSEQIQQNIQYCIEQIKRQLEYIATVLNEENN